MTKRIAGILFILFCTSVAWGILGATILARTYDTWCTAYTKPTQARVIPVAPPYIVPLRGIQIKIRFVDPATRLTREITIVQELLP